MPAKRVIREMEEKMRKTDEACRREFTEIRTGRASVGLVEGLRVSYYGTSTPLKQLASISTPEPRLIAIHPWDASSIADIEKAIQQSNIGITPNNDGKLIRLVVPHLTDERRDELVKIVHKMAEDAKISLRTIRRDANEEVKALKKKSEIAEDDEFHLHQQIQKITDKFSDDIDRMLGDKEKEIREV